MKWSGAVFFSWKDDLHELEQRVDGLDVEDLGGDGVGGHAVAELLHLQLLVLVRVAPLEHLGHHGGQVNLNRRISKKNRKYLKFCMAEVHFHER